LTKDLVNCYDDLEMKNWMIVFVIFVLVATPVYGQVTSGESSATTTPTVSTNSPTEKVSPRETVRNEAGENKGVLVQKRKEIITSRYERLKNRLQMFYERLVKLGQRIETRLTKLEETGNDVAEQKAALVTAQDQLTEANSKISGLDAVFETVVNSETPVESFEGLRTAVAEIKQIYTDVHGQYVDIVGQIKGLRKPEEATSSVVPTTSEPERISPTITQ